MELMTAAQEFLKKRMTRVSFRSSDLLPTVTGGWSEFLKEVPDEEKARWTVRLPNDPPHDPDGGYRRGAPKGVIIPPENRKPGDGNDPKSRFHFHPYLYDYLSRRGADWRPWADWLWTCGELYQRGRKFMNLFMTELADHLELPATEFDILGTKLRLLQYDPKPDGAETIVAQPHHDRSSLTLHIAESYPGLLVKDAQDLEPTNGNLVEIPQNTALVFPSGKFANLTRELVPPLTHWVVDKDKGGTTRWSVVFFYHLKPRPQ